MNSDTDAELEASEELVVDTAGCNDNLVDLLNSTELCHLVDVADSAQALQLPRYALLNKLPTLECISDETAIAAADCYYKTAALAQFE